MKTMHVKETLQFEYTKPLKVFRTDKSHLKSFQFTTYFNLYILLLFTNHLNSIHYQNQPNISLLDMHIHLKILP